MNKLKLLPIAVALALLLGGCEPLYFYSPGESDEQPPTSSVPALEYDKYLSEYEEKWQYRYLDKEEQAHYGAIYTTLTDRFDTDESVTVGGETRYGMRVPLPTPLHTREEAAELYNAFFRDNPRFFYVDTSYGLEGYMLDDTAYYDTLVLAYTMDATTRATADTQLMQAANELVAGCPEGQDAYWAELYLHDKLVEHCSYADAAAEDGGYDTYPQAFNAYGALVEKQAVCEGYARAMQLLLDMVHIPSTLVTGRSRENDQEHMWNLVTINGQNYHLDVTWDDSEDRLRHSYFNLTTALLERTHSINDGQAGIDTCTAEADNYHIRKGAYFDTYERDAIAEYIAAAFLAGETVIEMRFAPSKYDNALLFLKNHGLTRSKVDLFLPDGHTPLWTYELLGERDQCILTIVKES
ncbi:MAG: hypothetical protein IJ518_06975 [Clostridia bacterium]|nr:hypothetical protein [Clostridia bacterium]